MVQCTSPFIPPSNAYTLVLHKQGKKLYDALKGVIKDHLLLEVYNKISELAACCRVMMMDLHTLTVSGS